MAGRQRDKLIAPAGEKHIAVDEQRAGALSNKGREDRVEIAFSDRSQDKNLHSDGASCILHGCASRAALALFGFTSRAMVLAPGTTSCKSPSCFAASPLFMAPTPVMLPPGRLRLATTPVWTGSAPDMNTIGIAVVAALAARVAAILPSVAMTVTRRFTGSAANSGSRWLSPCAQRYSTRTLRPST